MSSIDEGIVTFIRIPKNASTSIYAFLGDKNTIKNEDLCADNARYMNIFEPSHRDISDATETLGSDILDKPVLAVVRNPFDRLVSMFFFARKYNLGTLYDIDTNDFDDFVEGFYRLSKDSNFFHAMSQSQYISHDKCDDFTIVRFEKLSDGICSFISDNSLEAYFDNDSLEKLNSTSHNHYSDYYSPKSRGIVSDMWGCDLDKFSYSYN